MPCAGLYSYLLLVETLNVNESQGHTAIGRICSQFTLYSVAVEYLIRAVSQFMNSILLKNIGVRLTHPTLCPIS